MGGAPPPPLDFAPEGSEKTGFFGPEDRSPRGGVGVAEHHYGESVRARSRLGGSECAGVARGDTPETGPKPGPSQPGRPRGASPGTRVWIGGGGPEARQTRPTVTGQGPSRGAPRTPPTQVSPGTAPPGVPRALPRTPDPGPGGHPPDPPEVGACPAPRRPTSWGPGLHRADRRGGAPDPRRTRHPEPIRPHADVQSPGGVGAPAHFRPVLGPDCSVPSRLPRPRSGGGTPRTPRRWASRW